MSLIVPVTQTSPGCAVGRHARAYVHGEAADVVAQQLDLAGVRARAQAQAQRLDSLHRRRRRAQRGGRAVELREHPVARAS